MERVVYVCCSWDKNGPGSFFKKSFPSQSSSLPQVGSTVPPGCLVEKFGQLKQGVIVDARLQQNTVSVLVTTPTETQALRDILISANGWKEVSSFPG